MIASRTILFSALTAVLFGAMRVQAQDTPPKYRGASPVEAPAQEAPAGRRLVAVIGIDQYASWPVLNNAKSDAVGTSRLFQEKLGFKEIAPPLLDKVATKQAILHLIDDTLRRELKPDDDLIIFFAGHGTTRKDRVGADLVETGYIVPVDAPAAGDDEHWSDYIQLEPLLKSIGTLPARHILVILDSCQSGIALEAAAVEFVGQDRLEAPVVLQLSRKVITSARGNQQAQDNGPVAKHSLFTGILITGVESGKVDLFKEGVVTSTEIGLYLENAVGRYPHAGQTPDFGSFFADKRGDMRLELSGVGVDANPLGNSETPAIPKPAIARSNMAPRRNVPLTGAPGLEEEPRYSPSGNQIAFAWDRGDKTKKDIYVKTVGIGRPLQLTHAADADDGNPIWRFDGQEIAFMQYFPDKAKILSIPSTDGREKTLAVVAPRNEFGNGGFGTGMDWSHNGKYLVFPDTDSPDHPFSLYVLDLATGERRRLTTAHNTVFGDVRPVFSPDDQSVAFIRSSSLGVDDIYVVPFAGGEPQRLTQDNARLAGLTWMPDGQSILIASKRIGSFGLWKVSVPDGALEDLGVSGDLVESPTVSPDGSHLGFVEHLKNFNLWRFEIPDTGTPAGNPIKLVSSSKIETGPQYAPDGKRIAYESTQSGDPEIWFCDSDGTNATQLTNFRGPVTGSPKWSPDNRTVVFDSRAAGTADIYTMSIDDSEPRRLTDGKGDSHVPSWSIDGQWVFYASDRAGRNEIWKLAIKGGPPVQVTRQGGFAPLPSPDGKFIYYAKGPSVGGLWRVPVGGGTEEEVLGELCSGCWGLWAATDRGIYFSTDPITKHCVVEFFDFATKKITPVFTPSSPLPARNQAFAVSPDGKYILFSQVDQDQSNVVVMDISH